MATYSAPTGDFQTTVISTGSQLAAGGTTMTIGTGLTLPATLGILQIDYDSTAALGAASGPETVSYATYTSGTGAITGMTRGLAGTTGVTHENGAHVQCGPSAVYQGADQIVATQTEELPKATDYQSNVTNSTVTDPLIQRGTKPITCASGQETANISITFPVAFDDTNYQIFIEPARGADFASANETPYAVIDSKLAASVTVYFFTRTGTWAAQRTSNIRWMAIGKKAR